ncbi:hypothetical protein [Acinetobacter variabilis]|uniref:hypothetical protein n=1 Tax=Acinetobacter variabilis TaxID=70346 RepID=UPI00289BA8F6|nr:hypothetical protein [Acinetobacter variabilis]
MGTDMIPNLQEKYALLSDSQKDIFAGYGLRQIKHFVEISLPTIEAVLPKGAIVQGINAEGKMQAYNPDTDQYYLWISDLQWQTTQRASQAVDLKEDALEIWNIFDLKSYELIELSHVHRDFLQV